MISARDIAAFLGTALNGEDFEVIRASHLAKPLPSSIVFARSVPELVLERLGSRNDVLLLLEIGQEAPGCPCIFVPNARLAYAKVLQEYFEVKRAPMVEASARVGNVVLGKGCYIGHNAVIEDGVTIGDDTTILHGVVIMRGTSIGVNCTIKSNTVIGSSGFGFERDEAGIPVRIPHLGGVEIGDNVDLGAHNTVAAGTVRPTRIGRYVKTDDHVHVAHNVDIGESTMSAACAEISGSVKIGNRCWIGPNCSIVDGIEIQDDAFVGIGAVVTKQVTMGKAVAGNPARPIRPGSG